MYEQELVNLMSWIESKNKFGEYADNANHPIWGTFNPYELPHTFSYYGVIKGYIELYKTYKKPKYLSKAREAANFLCGLQKSSGQYKYDSFQHDIDSSVGYTTIHNALPSIALLDLYEVTGSNKYLSVAKKNIKWLFCNLWNGKYLTGIVNQDMCVVEALAKLYKFEKNEIYIERAKKIADWCANFQVKSGKFKGSFRRGKGVDDLVVPWYNSKSALGFYNLWKVTGEEKYYDICFSATEFVAKNISKSGLAHLFFLNNNRLYDLVLISPIGLSLYLLSLFNIKTDFDVKTAQQKDGSFLSSVGHNDKRDKIPTLAWNSFMFLYLASIAKSELHGSRVEPIDYRNFKESAINEGKIVFGENGLVIFNKGLLSVYTTKVLNGKFNYPNLKGDYNVRLIMDDCLHKEIGVELPSKLKFWVVPKYVVFPIFIFRSVLVRFLMLFFGSSLFDEMCSFRS